MLFCSAQFMIFFAVVFVLYWALPRASWRVACLLVASFYFYASWNKWLACIIFVSTFMDYCVAIGLEKPLSCQWKKALLVLSVTANLGLLAYFKYVNFFLESLQEVLRSAGASASLPLLEVMLPIGISFYTFEAINYTVDVYRGNVRAERNLFHFMLFITFFPHLVAGPIVRARDFLPQIRRPKRWDWLRMQLGIQFFLIGLIKKMVIADRMAIFADPVFANPKQFSVVAVWIAVLAYAIQIYCDFSGYTDMALGSAHLLGYKLAKNFDMPYLAANIADFWRRWHISLSTWLRDYLFIPLGGSRGGTWHTCRNLLITMTLGGLWHGAAWTFVFWGILHGVFLIVHRCFHEFCERQLVLSRWLQTSLGTALRILLTFLCVCVGWVFFRATTFAAAIEILKHLVGRHVGSQGAPLPVDSFLILAGALVLAHIAVRAGIWKRFSSSVSAPIWGAAYAILATGAMILAPEAGAIFIYFQF
jgi:alginate O-acetyltransferase complex protein AlgI